MAEEKRITTFTTPIIVALLVVVAFLAGMFWTRIRYGDQGKAPEKEARTSPTPGAPQEGMPLTEEQIAKIETGGAAVKGEKDTPITIVEFSEYQCPFCGRYVEETYPQILEEYGDQTYYIFHDYPLQFHQHAQTMAEIARCAGDQGQYWEMHDLIFENQEAWSNKENLQTDIDTYASQLGLDKEAFDNCLDSGKYTQTVKDDLQLGTEVGVQGTPTFFINGQKIVGALPFADFQAVIEAELAK